MNSSYILFFFTLVSFLLFFIFFCTDLTSLFHPDKEEPSVTSLESLTNKGNEENINNETYSIFTRNRSGSAGSDRTSSAPPSPMKDVRSPEFPSVTPGFVYIYVSCLFTFFVFIIYFFQNQSLQESKVQKSIHFLLRMGLFPLPKPKPTNKVVIPFLRCIFCLHFSVFFIIMITVVCLLFLYFSPRLMKKTDIYREEHLCNKIQNR